MFGVEAAAQRYFHKPASKLTRSEAALLAAVLPNPLRFKVSAPSGYVRSRQAWILRQMYQLGGEPFMQQHQLDCFARSEGQRFALTRLQIFLQGNSQRRLGDKSFP